MKEVTKGIYQIPLPLPDPSLGHVNVYLATGSQHVLIDCGWPSEAAFVSLRDQLSEAGIGLNDINLVVITHAHVDHFGLLDKLKRKSDAEVAFHYLEAEFIKSRFISRDVYPGVVGRRLDINGMPQENASYGLKLLLERGKDVQPFSADLKLAGGEVVSTGSLDFQILWTPGHASGHICLYEPNQRVLLSGDHILPSITPVIGLHPGAEASGLDYYLNSLERMRGLKPELVLPGHGNPFFDLQERIDQLVQHHRDREREIMQAIEDARKTAYQIAAELPWIYGGKIVTLRDLSAPNQVLAVLETVSHLEYMESKRKTVKSSKDNTEYFIARGTAQ